MKPKYFFLLCLSFCIVHPSFNITQATVRFVSKTGSSTPPYTSWQTAADSIQKCINICIDGDTIYVANGIYKENLVINTAISLIGSSMDSTMIDGTGLTVITVEYVQHGIGGSFENFTILGKGFDQGVGILTVKNILVKNCRIKNDQGGISVINEGYQIENVIITNVVLGVFGGCASINCNNVLKNCVIVVPNNTSQGVSTGSGNYEISNNIILYTGDANFESGIYVSAANKINITNNLISKFGNGISFDVVLDTALVKNNIITYQSSSGSTGGIISTNDILFVNNMIFINNKKGIYGGGLVRSNYNIFWNNDVNLVGVAYGDSDIVADPMLVKDTIPRINGTYDFHLQAFSPGIDKGDPTILDVDGSRSDIGMYGGPFGETYTYQDLAPLAPRNLSAIVDSNNITVRWNRNTESDTSYYKVYRDTVSGFQIDSTKLVSSTSDSFFVQVNPHINIRYIYKVICVDKQGNESKPSTELVVTITPVSMDDYPMTINNYQLYQNYPNPFNPNTKIGYQLKERAYVKLMIYDIKGELISVLVNKEQNAGYYEAEFFSSSIQNPVSSIKGIASGIYLYRIEVIGEGKIPIYTEMKKMLLIK